jgi:DNA-binding transcriptional MocR family regulator
MSKAINLQSNYPVLAEQDADWNRLLHSAVDRFAPESLRLPAFGGSMENRRLAAAWLDVPVERTFIGTCGHHGLIATLMAAGLVGKTVAVEALTYPWFVRQAQMLGMRVVPVALDECMQPEALRAVCKREPIAAVYTMPSLHNPTGAVASLARREAMVKVAREFGLTIIEDAAYGFLVADEPPRYVALAPERAFYVESLSKRVAPGLRTAFLVAPETLAAQAELALRLTTSGSSTLLASLGCAMAGDGSLAAVIEAKRVEGALRSAKAVAILSGLDVVAAPNSWHLWVTLPEGGGLTAESVEAACERRGVLVTGAHWFTAPDTVVPRAVRVGLGGETEWERVAEGLKVFRELVLG